MNPQHRGAVDAQGELFVEIGQIDKANERLAKLKHVCPFGCEQSRASEEAIEHAPKRRLRCAYPNRTRSSRRRCCWDDGCSRCCSCMRPGSRFAAYDGVVRYSEAYGVPGVLLPAAIALELGGGLWSRWVWRRGWRRLCSRGFACSPRLCSHRDFGEPGQLPRFEKDLAIAGGFLVLACCGAGAWSLDRMVTRRWTPRNAGGRGGSRILNRDKRPASHAHRIAHLEYPRTAAKSVWRWKKWGCPVPSIR